MTEKEYMGLVASLGCVACRKDGVYGVPAHLHHPRGKVGIGMKSSDFDVIPLCPAHHVGLGMKRDFPSVHMNPKDFHIMYGSDIDLISEVRVAISKTYGSNK
jgi:hypothetical protein